MSTVREATGHGPTDAPTVRRRGIGVRWSVALGLAVVAIAGGVIVARWYPGVLRRLPWLGFGSDRSASASHDDGAAREAGPAELRERLQFEYRRLAELRRDLDGRAKRVRIGYSIMRRRGFKEDERACQEQLRLQQQLTAEIAQLDECQRGLSEEIDRLGSLLSENPRGISRSDAASIQQLLGTARALFAKQSASEELTTDRIPDYQWQGGADAYMRVNEDDRPSARRPVR